MQPKPLRHADLQVCVTSSMFVAPGTPVAPKPKGLPFIQELAMYRSRARTGSRSHRPGSGSRRTGSQVSRSRYSMEYTNSIGETFEMASYPSTPVQEDPDDEFDLLKEGTLIKTSQSKTKGASVGHSRPRKFRLTTDFLDYLYPFSHVRRDERVCRVIKLKAGDGWSRTQTPVEKRKSGGSNQYSTNPMCKLSTFLTGN